MSSGIFFPVVNDETPNNFTKKLKCALETDFAYARTKKIDIFQRFCISKHCSIVHSKKNQAGYKNSSKRMNIVI